MQLYTSPYIGMIYAKQKGYNKVYIYFNEIAFALQTLFQTPICNNPSNIGDGVKLELLQIRQKPKLGRFPVLFTSANYFIPLQNYR